MNYKDYQNNKDIKFAILLLEKELERRKKTLKEAHLLSPQKEGLIEDLSCIESSIRKIRDNWGID